MKGGEVTSAVPERGIPLNFRKEHLGNICARGRRYRSEGGERKGKKKSTSGIQE